MKRPTDEEISLVLHNNATKNQANAVAGWFATKEGQKHLFELMHSDLSAIEKGESDIVPDSPNEELYERILNRIDSLSRRRNIRRFAFRAACIIVPCVLILGMWINLNERTGGLLFSKAEIVKESASMGERKQIVFQDGSKVYLNAGTTIYYPQHFGLGKREITLDGEGYFEVAHNERRPFVVKTGKTYVKVLGTTFDLKAYKEDDYVDIILYKGAVSFNANSKEYLMKPSQKLIYDGKTGVVSIVSDNKNNEMESLWKDNIIAFRNAPLKEVLTSLSRWYDVEFQVVDANAYNCKFSFKTEQTSLDSILSDLQLISSLRFEREGNKITVKSL